jgi:uncharacterized LabA/DUF88 family protein
LTEARLKIAVFIDFDNIEIGVKTTLSSHFDVGAVLEAIKERGEVVTKVAYGDWTRAGDYSRSLTQHGIHMVQRNLTPGGDKNGADINLALDALEMAFTHSHINTFVIVGGDSDFMALVEKLKQYDRKVLVVGGRAFTSNILQKNCHEFIAYENLVGRRGGRGRAGQETPLTQGVTLVRRALKVLADREVSPQLGVLKSTLLQLDPTFSEREYGASTFRDLIQRMARAGYVSMKGTDRNIYVELREGSDAPLPGSTTHGRDGDGAPATPLDAFSSPAESAAPAASSTLAASPGAPAAQQRIEPAGDEGSTAAAVERQQADGYRAIREVFVRPGSVSRWPLYLRQVKQVLRAADEGFDERRYGFSGLVEALRYGQREGLFRLDRDRQGVLRVYPGALLQRPEPSPTPDGTSPLPAEPSASESATAEEPTPVGLFEEATSAGAAAEEAADMATVAAPEPDRAAAIVEAPARRRPARKNVAKRAAAAAPKGRARQTPARPSRSKRVASDTKPT